MKNLCIALITLALVACQSKPASDAVETDSDNSIDSLNQNTFVESITSFMKGTDVAIKTSCSDSCTFIYQDYTVFTKSNADAPGESIVITNIDTKLKQSIVIKEAEGAQYFEGLVGNFAIIDFGTGNVRDKAIYDLQNNSMLTHLSGIVNEPSISNGKLTYDTLLSEAKVKALKLPLCSNPDLEISGYTETMIFDFSTKKITSTQKYDCIK